MIRGKYRSIFNLFSFFPFFILHLFLIMKKIVVLLSLCAVACAPKNDAHTPVSATTAVATPTADLSKLSRATFAGGCFWCEEAVFESIKGVSESISGYSGGHTENPTYEDSNTGATGHAESVEIYYDPSIVTYNDLLKVYFASIDPTQANGQGPDRGSQYRSIVFYRNTEEEQAARAYIDNLTKSGTYSKPIAVEVVPFKKFWEGEKYHQNYVVNHPENPYVQHESLPRKKRTLALVPELVK